jgi:hypothetical protein
MKTIKLAAKLFLIISLFASISLADEGHMGGGGFAPDGHMGGGGYTCEPERDENCPDDEGDGLTGSIMIYIKKYLEDLFG